MISAPDKLQMDFVEDQQSWWRIKWQWAFIIVALAGIAAGLVGKIASLITALSSVSAAMIFISKSAFLISGILFAFGILVLAYSICQMLRENTDKLENLENLFGEQQKTIKSIDLGVRLSETAKQIAYRDADWQGLRETVLEKLHKHDFDSTYQLISDIARRDDYRELASQLKKEADSYKNANEDERAAQIIGYIEKLMEQHHWVKAAEQIDRLVNAFPNSDKAKSMSMLLRERKDMRKKELLAEWDMAVKKQETDKSLAILHELDLYLTPSEGLALQESAKDAFRSKLHNLGVQFSLAVADKQWKKAVETGQEIIRGFPNSRMAVEIRNKMAVLTNLAEK